MGGGIVTMPGQQGPPRLVKCIPEAYHLAVVVRSVCKQCVQSMHCLP